MEGSRYMEYINGRNERLQNRDRNCKWDSSNTYLVNELNLPIVIQGLSDVIVAASPNGILVTEKSKSEEIKPLIQNINGRPMYEELGGVLIECLIWRISVVRKF